MSMLLSFLTGSAARMVWGEVSSWISAAREHKREIERMRVQEEIDARQHERNMDSIRLQHDLKVEVIRVQGDVDLEKLREQSFAASVSEGMKPTGIKLVDAWNASIRPAAASIALWLWLRHLWVNNWAMAGRDWELVCGILGWFFADRTLGKRGK